MADFIWIPSANTGNDATGMVRTNPLNVAGTTAMPDETYDVFVKVVSSFQVVGISAQFAVANVGEEPVITASNGNVSVTIGSGIHAGTYTTRITDGATLTVAMIEAAATPIILPTISGTTAEGDTLTIQPGVWLRAGDPIAAPTFEQQLDGVATGETDLGWIVVQDDLAQDFTVEETYGGVTIESAAVEIPAKPAVPAPAFLGLGTSSGETFGSSQTYQHDMTGHNQTQDVILMFGGWVTNTANNQITAVTLNGVASTAHFSTTVTTSFVTIVGYARFPAGVYPDSSTVVLTGNGELREIGSASYNVGPAATISRIVTLPSSPRDGSDLSANTTAGDGLIGASHTFLLNSSTWTGLPEDMSTVVAGAFTTASAINVAAESPRNISIAGKGSTSQTSALLLKVES